MTFSTKNLLTNDELHRLVKDGPDTVKLLDASFTLPGTSPTAHEVYQQKRLGDAVFFDIDKAAEPNSDLPHMVPDDKIFEDYVRSLGISNSDHIVIYGQNSVAMGPARAVWMFRLFGHEKISLLNGSLKHWEAQGYPVETGPTPSPTPSTYKARRDDTTLALLKDVFNAQRESSAIVIDARPPERFSGHNDEPRPGLRAGHIPGSFNIPASKLINPETGGLVETRQINECLSAAIGENIDKPVISTCGSGVTACVLSLGLELMGYKNTKVYDGSWSEWGQDHLDTPVHTKPR